MFFNKFEKNISEEFLKNGYIIRSVKNRKLLKKITDTVLILSAKIIQKKFKLNKNWLNNSHKYIETKDLNNFRLKLYRKINQKSNFKKTILILQNHILKH